MYICHSKESIALLTPKEEVAARILSSLDSLDFLCDVLEARKNILALTTIVLSDLPYEISSYETLRDKRNTLPLLFACSSEKIIDKKRRYLITCEKEIIGFIRILCS